MRHDAAEQVVLAGDAERVREFHAYQRIRRHEEEPARIARTLVVVAGVRVSLDGGDAARDRAACRVIVIGAIVAHAAIDDDVAGRKARRRVPPCLGIRPRADAGHRRLQGTHLAAAWEHRWARSAAAGTTRALAAGG